MTSRSTEHSLRSAPVGTDIQCELDGAVARLRKDVVSGFAADYCVASRPALEIVLDALQQLSELQGD